MPLFCGRPVARISALVPDVDLDLAGHVIYNVGTSDLSHALMPKSYIDTQNVADRAYADSLDVATRNYIDTGVEAHRIDTTDVHGISTCSKVETISNSYAPYIIGNTPLTPISGVHQTNSTTYTRLVHLKLKYLNPPTTVIRIKYRFFNEDGTELVYARVYRNGQPYGPEQSTMGTVDITEDLEFSQGDTVELWGKVVNVNNKSGVAYFYISGTDQRQIMPNGIEVDMYDA